MFTISRAVLVMSRGMLIKIGPRTFKIERVVINCGSDVLIRTRVEDKPDGIINNSATIIEMIHRDIVMIHRRIEMFREMLLRGAGV